MQWVGALTMNLFIDTSSNPAGTFIIVTFPKYFKDIFWSNIMKFENSKHVKVF